MLYGDSYKQLMVYINHNLKQIFHTGVWTIIIGVILSKVHLLQIKLKQTIIKTAHTTK